MSIRAMPGDIFIHTMMEEKRCNPRMFEPL